MAIRTRKGPLRQAILILVLLVCLTGLPFGTQRARADALDGLDAAAPAVNPYIFGIASHAWWLDPNVYGSQLFPALDDLKVTTVRLSIDWRRFEPSPGVFDWSMYDRTFDTLAQHHIVIVADFNTIPPWASVNPSGCADPNQEIHACGLRDDMLPAFKQAIQAAVSRYAWIEYWEFWNEPEMWHYFGGDSYLRYLRIFYDIAHSINPDITVAACTLAGPDYINYIWNVSDLWYGKGHQPWDAVAYHPYNTGNVKGPDGQPMPLRFDLIEQLHQLMVKRGGPNMKIWITEYGWNTGVESQSANLIASLTWFEQHPYIQFAHLHMLHDWTDDAGGEYGLMAIVPDANGQRVLTPQTRFTPKPLYYDAFKDFPRGSLPPMPSGPGLLAFSETGHTISGQFLTAWKADGGLRILGEPLTRPYPLEQPDGSWLLVQDFERGQLEFHPNLVGTRYAVQGTLIGDQITAGRRDEAPFKPLASCTPGADRDCFSQTGHSLAYGFRAFWQAHGGLATFGYPISEEFQEKNPDTGQVYTVQYFERARFEWHPDLKGTDYEVELGRLGAALIPAAWLSSSDPRLPTQREFQ